MTHARARHRRRRDSSANGWLARCSSAVTRSTGADSELAFDGPTCSRRDERARASGFTADMRDADAIDRAVETQSRRMLIVHLAGDQLSARRRSRAGRRVRGERVGAVRLLASVAAPAQRGHARPGRARRRQREAVRPARRSRRCRSTSAREQRPLDDLRGDEVRAGDGGAAGVRATDGVRVDLHASFNHSGVGHGAEYLLPALVARVRTHRAGERERALARERRRCAIFCT